ncbi:MAG: cytochrome c-type biogenesis protein [Halieaceae bacterium]
MKIAGFSQALLFVGCLLMAAVASAVIETYEFSSPELQQRYQLLSAELRCPKCQNQNIADSNAPIAQDLRKLLYEQLEAGASNDEILDYMVSRYGEFVRYRPAFDSSTAVLWLAPVLLFIAALVVLFLSLRQRKESGSAGQVELSGEEQQQLQQMLSRSEQDR